MYQQNAHLLLFCAALQIGYLVSSSLHLHWVARKTTWKIWAFGCLAQIIGLLVLSHQFYNLAADLKPEGPLFELGFGFCVTGGMNFVYLFEDLRGTSKTVTFTRILVFLLAGGILVGSVDGFLNRLIMKDLVLISLSFWLLWRVIGLTKKKTLVEANILLFTLLLFSFSSLYYLWVFMEYQFLITPPDSLVKTFVESMDAQVGLVGFLYMAMGFHWTSVGAQASLKYRLDNEKIKSLMTEKDLLIQSLLKANVLVESGALSAGLSHEINQFLSVIQLNTELAIHALQEQARPEDVRPYLDKVIKSNHLAATLIESLKQFFSKRESMPEPCRMDDLIRETVDFYNDRLRNSKIELILDLATQAEVILWRALMRQVIGNLLVNSIEALDLNLGIDKRILIRSEIVKGTLRFSISDNGLGLNKAVVGDVFSLFQTSKTHGTGLGLWLSQHIVEKHHGLIRHASLQGGGVEFSVTLPLLSREELLTSRDDELYRSKGFTA